MNLDVAIVVSRVEAQLRAILPFVKVIRRPGRVMILASDRMGRTNPITIPGSPDVTGAAVEVLSGAVDFWEITSSRPGGGGRIVAAVLAGVPAGAAVRVHVDMSGGFWAHVAAKYPQFRWVL